MVAPLVMKKLGPRASVDVLLVNALAEDFKRELADLIEALSGIQQLFRVPLSRAEVQQVLANATPPQWQQWLAQIQAYPDERDRRQAGAELFRQWAEQQLGQSGLYQPQEWEVAA